MSELYPLRFQPIFRRYIWGGRRLESLLGKSLGEGGDYAESWEIVDHGDDQSVVTAGAFAGTTLNELVTTHGQELLGMHDPQARFPLLFKLLDAHRALSVQVHPDDMRAAKLDPPDLGKTEAWVVLHADPGSLIYAGLKRGFDREALTREISRGTCELCLHRFEPQAGDCVFIPAGTVHALGAGLVIAEVQQSSDTTFRLFDWGRVDADGQPRPLHIDQALGAIDYSLGPVSPRTPQPTSHSNAVRLVECDKFVLDRWQMNGNIEIGGDNRFHILCVTSGSATIDHDPCERPLGVGETMLLPAIHSIDIQAARDTVILDMYLPA